MTTPGEKERLLPCPFCGCADNDAASQCAAISDDLYSIWCGLCLAEGPACDSEAEAIAAWNKRSVSSDRAGVIEECIAAAEEATKDLAGKFTRYGVETAVNAIRALSCSAPQPATGGKEDDK